MILETLDGRANNSFKHTPPMNMRKLMPLTVAIA